MRLGLGTVQFGLDYGISNRRGKCPPDEVARILDRAWRAGVRTLDTAAQYGNSEEIVGRGLSEVQPFEIITKAPPLVNHDSDSIQGLVSAVLDRSLHRLKQKSVYGLLVHHCSELLSPHGSELYQALKALKESGRVQKIGTSVYDGEQIDALLERFDLDIVQLPISALDQRLPASGRLSLLQDAGIEIHARSIFLQGLLLMAPERLPTHFNSVRAILEAFHEEAKKRGLTPLSLSLAYIKQQSEIDRIFVGVSSLEELSEILDAWPIEPDTSIDFSNFAVLDESLVNPARWPTTDQ